MKLREEIEPKIIQAEEIYPQVLNLIHEYDDACDNEDDNKCEEVARQLSELTGKEITEDDLFEHWELDGDDQIAFGFSLAEPSILSTPLSKDELFEIVQRIRDPKHDDLKEIDENAPFPKELLWWRLNDYYIDLLELNLKLPKRFSIASLFNRQKVNGEYVEFTSEEILEKILGVIK